MILLVAAGSLLGCGQPPAESAVPATSEHHGGILVPLTEGRAYVELLNGERGLRNKVAQTTVVAYLLQPDLKHPLAATPTSLEVRLGTPKGDQVVPLRPSPDPADPLGSARFVSAAGPFELNQVGGEVTVKVGGKTLSGTFRGPR